MTSLKTLQEEMKGLVFYPKHERSTSFLWKDGLPKRLDVYRNNTRLNWADALDQDFAMTRRQFTKDEWQELCKKYFVQHPPASWELNTALSPFVKFLSTQNLRTYVKELADYEWHDLQSFIHRAIVKKGTRITNPTAMAQVFKHQIFDWVEKGAPEGKPPEKKPEVLVFFRDSKLACHILEADPLMLLMMDHFRKPGRTLEGLETARQKLLPQNVIPLHRVFKQLLLQEILL